MRAYNDFFISFCSVVRAFSRHEHRSQSTVSVQYRVLPLPGRVNSQFCVYRTATPQSNMAAAVALAARSRAERLSQSKAETTAPRSIPENAEVRISNIVPWAFRERSGQIEPNLRLFRLPDNFIESPAKLKNVIVEESLQT